jgi:DNA repair protein RecN (Recombination protein N)
VLSFLRIASFATIEEISISFDNGLTVITGETGAGKSLLIDALSFIGGEKPRNLSIRPGCEEGVVEALFTPPTQLPEQLLDILSPSDEIVIRRILSVNGRIRQTINGQTVSLSQLQALVPLLYDLVGQGENVRISQTETHRQYIDAFAQTTDMSENFEAVRRGTSARKKERDSLIEQIDKSRQDRERQMQIQDDAERLSGRPLEFEELSRTLSAQLNLQELLELSTRSYNSLYDDDQSVLASLGRIHSDLAHILDYDKSLLHVQEVVQGAIEVLKDAARELRHYQESLEMDPVALSSLEDRFNLYRRLAQKYQVRPEQLVAFFSVAATSGDDALERQLNEIEVSIQVLEQKLLTEGQRLTEKRAQCFSAFSDGIAQKLRSLRIDNPNFSVKATPYESPLGGPFGMEKIEFLFSANPGIPAKPLGQTASGGEISRVLLAIKSVLSDNDTIPTLVFDEIDSGIGGEVGEVLGDLLKEIGKKRQVITISHLHQVARKGDNHFLVRKTTVSGKTRSQISKIDGEDRVREIARMLGGESISPSTMTIARELLK